MNVVRLPPVEPWPTELFATYSILDLEALIDGAHAEIVKRRSAAVDTTTCPDCAEFVHPSSTSCEGCGAHLTPSNTTAPARASLDGPRAQGQKEAILPMVTNCTCGGNNVCLACTFAEYDGETAHVNQAHDALEAALERPANVTPLKNWSVKA